MRIGILVEDLTRRGGTERAAINLANMLSKNKEYEIELITFNSTNKELPFFVNENIKIQKKFFPSIGTSKLKRIKWYLRLCSYYIKESKKYDYMIGTTHLINILGILFKNKKVKYISCEHANYMAISKIIRGIRKIVYKFSYKIIVLTKDDYNKYCKFINLNKLEIIPNSLPYEVDKISLLNNKEIIAVGRIVALKGYDILLKSLVEVFEKHNSWKLKIIGEGPEKENLIKLAKELKISKNIVFKGEMKEVVPEYLKSDFLILSSKREGFPMVILEAMQCGLPVVSFDCPTGPKEIIETEKNGILVNYLDQKDLTNSVLKLIENPDLMKEMGIKAKLTSKKYTENKILEKWLCILKK